MNRHQAVYLLLFTMIYVTALPNLLQKSHSPWPIAFPIHARPLPSETPMAKRGITSSDLLCRAVYIHWIMFLADFAPPILNPVQSTEVSFWRESEFGRKYMLVNCLDIRDAFQWSQVYRRQQALQAQAEQAVLLIGWFRWKWKREESQQGWWILECPAGTVAQVEPRVNQLGWDDTYGECVPDIVPEPVVQEETKLWWETDPRVRFPNQPWDMQASTSETGNHQSMCQDVEVPDEQQKQTTSTLAFVAVTLVSICSANHIHRLNSQQCPGSI